MHLMELQPTLLPHIEHEATVAGIVFTAFNMLRALVLPILTLPFVLGCVAYFLCYFLHPRTQVFPSFFLIKELRNQK